MANTCPKCNTKNPDSVKFCGECGTQLPGIEDIEVTETLETPTEELTTGSTFAGRYQVIEELGKGGMGKVYKVLDKEVNAKIALKLIKPEIASDKKTIERFRNELKVARDIAHKNVCRMYHLGKEEGAYYITMEYVSGEDLKSFIRRSGVISVGKAISIANQVCDGLFEAHRLGVVHRDLKPQNIMIDKEGNARIMDFGIARSLRAKGITGSGVMIGTPEYMSPEQVDGKEADQRADIYSLGVILYEMVTGRVPFVGDTPFSIGVKQKSETPRPPKEINEQIPEDLNRVILKCMEKEKENRYQSVSELHSELINLEKGIPTTERTVPERKPLTSREITVQFSLKKLIIPALVITAIIIIGLVLWKILPSKKPAPSAPSGKPSLAVMYFENNTGDLNLDHYRKVISDLLITDLSQSKYLQVLSGAKLFNILDKMGLLEEKTYSSEALREIGNQGRVRYVIVGSYSKAGDVYKLNYSLLDGSTSDIVGTGTVQGRGEENIWTMVDEITPKIKANLNLSGKMLTDDFDRNIGKITTSSPEAYKYYIEGRDYHNKGEERKSIASMEKAVAIDPEFAMAYRSMAATYGNYGYASEKKKYLKKAFELKDRLSDRESLLIQGQFYQASENTYGEAIEAYEKLLELYPKDSIGNVYLGMLYASLEEWDKAIEFYNVPILNNDDTIFPYFNMADAYEAKGLYDKAIEVLERYRDNFSDDPLIHYSLALDYLDQGKFDPAQIELDNALSISPLWFFVMAKGDLCLYRGDMERAEKVYRQLLEETEISARISATERLAALYTLQGRFSEAQDHFNRVIELADNIGETARKYTGHLWLAQIYLKTGNPEDALKELKKVLEVAKKEGWLDKQRWILLGKTLAHIETKSLDAANNTKDELEDLIRTGKNQRLIRYPYLLNGKIELEKENYPSAVEEFEKAKSFLSFQWDEIHGEDHAVFFYSLASAYYKAGEFEKALLEFGKTTKLTIGRLFDGDIYAKSFYMLGKINEEQGDTVKAIENYDRFLDLWKDADPGIAEVEDARKRLAGLKEPS